MKYDILKENILAHELIGLQARVLKSNDPCKKGLRGKIVDETQHTLVFEWNGKEFVVPKKEVVLEVMLLNGERLEIDGKKIEEKPEDRVKKFLKKK